MLRSTLTWALAVAAAVSALTLPAHAAPRIDWDRCLTYDAETGRPIIDPICFFEALVDRYRRLSEYEDFARVVHVTRRHGEEPTTVETRIGCEIAGGELRVQTPASEMRRRLGLDVSPPPTSPVSEAELKYKLWLAPHMALKFTDQPTTDFRPGVEEGFTATEAEEVTIDERPMVHLELKSGDGLSENCEARFDLYVNPESLLVERVEGQHRLPDGANFETTVEITPVHVEDVVSTETSASTPAGTATERPTAVVEDTPALDRETPALTPSTTAPGTPTVPPGPPHEVVGRE